MDVGALMDGVLLDEARVVCIGNSRDEALAREVSEILWNARRRPVLTTSKHQNLRAQAGIAASAAVHFAILDAEAAIEASGRNLDSEDNNSLDDSASDESIVLQQSADRQLPSYTPGGIADGRRARRANAVLHLENARIDGIFAKVVSGAGDPAKRARVSALPLYAEDAQRPQSPERARLPKRV